MLSVSVFGQLPPEQRVLDFQTLVTFYARTYAPAQWKRDALQVNILDTAPWIERIRAAKDDLAYYEILMEYVASFRDTHTLIELPSFFRVRLGFTVDIFEGKVLVDTIDRGALPEADFPFAIGDELLSVDGRSLEDWITDLSRMRQYGNPAASRRIAASKVSVRWQDDFPRTAELGETANVEIRLASGERRVFTMRWLKSGTPVTRLGPVPGLRALNAEIHRPGWEPMYVMPKYDRLQSLRDAGRWQEAEFERQYLAAIGDLRPWFELPEGAEIRVGSALFAPFFSATLPAPAGEPRVSFLRIPRFGGIDIRTLRNEIAWHQENSDALILDISRNPGGSCIYEEIASLLTPGKFRPTQDRFRPTFQIIDSFRNQLASAQRGGAPAEVQDAMRAHLTELEQAYFRGDLLGPSTSSCSFLNERTSDASAYTKPLIVLIDELSISAADYLATTLRDNKRGIFIGKRTNGAGGAVVSGGQVTALSEVFARTTISLGVRQETQAMPGLPASPYIENVGIAPDIELDSMTRENLLARGAPFLQRVLEITKAEIAKAKAAN